MSHEARREPAASVEAIGAGWPVPLRRTRHDRALLSDVFDRHATVTRLAADHALDDLANADMAIALVRSGKLCAARELPADRRKVLFFYFPGDVMFVDAFRGQQGVRLRAIGDVEISVLSKVGLAAMRQSEREPVASLFDAAVDHLTDLLLHSVAIARLTSEERLATFFLEIALRAGRSANGTVTFDFDMRRDDIADYLGLNRDTLSRAMTKLRRDSVVSFISTGRVIARLDKLSARTPLAASFLGGLAAA